MTRLRTLALLSVVLAALAVVAACGGEGSETTAETQSNVDVPPNAVAVVAGTPILRSDFERFFDQAEKAAEARDEPFPEAGSQEYLDLQNQAVDYLIQRVEIAKEAEAMGITVTDQEITDRLDEFKQQFFEGDDEKYKEELEKVGLTEEDLREDIRAQIINEKVYEEVTKDVTVTDEDVRAYYDENKEQFTIPESREVAHILVETKKKADELYEQLMNGASFEELAKEHSTDEASAEDGGRLTDQKGTFVPEFEEVAFSLETGEIGKPVKSDFGWHIIKALKDTVKERTMPFDEVKDSIKEQLLRERRDEKMAAWLEDVEAKYEPQIGYAAGFAAPPEPPSDTSSTETETVPATTGG